jgi:hypothetical protein
MLEMDHHLSSELHLFGRRAQPTMHIKDPCRIKVSLQINLRLFKIAHFTQGEARSKRSPD